MAVLLSVVSLAFSLLLTPFLMFLLSIIFLASMGKSLGVRRLYIKLLLALFEYGRQNIEHVKKTNGTWTVQSEDSEEEGAGDGVTPNNIKNLDNNKINKFLSKKTQNGAISNNTVIARSKDLILLPEPEMMQNHKDDETEKDAKDTKDKQDSHLSAAKETDLTRKKSFETLKREFELATCLDYIKAGIEAIIEDDVTSRFEAEELKNWNLLTRTNRRYEFISWKLTVIWMCGFLMRYFFLLPLRILICFVGIVYLVITTFSIGFISNGPLKRWANDCATRIFFRIMSRSLSSLITIHNPEYKPKSGGICVANHTSTIDVCILSTETTFSLVKK